MSIQRLLTDTMTVRRPTTGQRDSAAGPKHTTQPAVYEGVACKAFPKSSSQQLQAMQLGMNTLWDVFCLSADATILNGDLLSVGEVPGVVLRVTGVVPYPATGRIPAYLNLVCESVSH